MLFASILYLSVLLDNYLQQTTSAGMKKFRIDQDFLIEHWHVIYVMSVVFAEINV